MIWAAICRQHATCCLRSSRRLLSLIRSLTKNTRTYAGLFSLEMLLQSSVSSRSLTFGQSLQRIVAFLVEASGASYIPAKSIINNKPFVHKRVQKKRGEHAIQEEYVAGLFDVA